MDILTLAIAKSKSGSPNGTITTENITNALGYKPADQEEVSKLSEEISNVGKPTDEQVKSAVNDYLDENGVVLPTTVEPEDDDIPKVFFSEAIPQTKDDAVTAFRYISKTQDISGYAEFKAQGNSSMSYPKKNMTVKMYSDEALTEKLKVKFKEWAAQAKHVYKANWIDLTHARNIVSARLWSDVVKSRKNYLALPELLRTSPNQGAVDGFPVKVYSKGIYQGRYTLNIPKDAWMANMDDSLDEHCILCGEGYNSGCFRSASMSEWTDEVHDSRPTIITNRWLEVINFVMNSTDEEFVANLENYFFVDSLIDYLIFGMVSCGLDAFGKNQLYFTYDGVKWIASMYDMDTTWGLYWNGSKFVSASYSREEYEDFVSTQSSGEGNLLYIRLAKLFYAEIQARYAELKQGALSVPNIINHFERFTDIAPLDLVKEDYASTTASGKFTGIPSQSTNNIQQIRKYIVDRYVYCDEYFASLGENGGEVEPDEPTTPDNPEVTLTSISATYSGGDVEVGLDVNSLSGITVTATYSDGTTATVTGYTLSGEIDEGENTITVSYNGLTTTFTVIGTEIEGRILYKNYSPNGVSFSTETDINFNLGEFVEASIDVSNVTQTSTIFSVGKGISNWGGDGARYHICVTTNGFMQLNVLFNNSNARKEIKIDKSVYVIKVDRDGLYVDGALIEAMDTNNAIYENAKSTMLEYDSVEVGASEGNVKSNATYNYIKVVGAIPATNIS